MSIDAWEVFAGVVTALGIAGGVEVGLAFLMRSPREAAGGSDDR